MRRRYDVAGEWSPDIILPSVREDTGQLVGNTGQRLERILAIAWHGGVEYGHEVLDPERGLHADNLTSQNISIRSTRQPFQSRDETPDEQNAAELHTERGATRRAPARILPHPRRPAACVSRVLAAAPECTHISQLASRCGISVDTTYNYLAKGTALVGQTSGVLDLIDIRLRATVEALPDVSGSLSAVAARVIAVDPDLWEHLESPYNQLRIVRMVVEDARQAASTRRK